MSWNDFTLFLLAPAMGGLYFQLFILSGRIERLSVEIEHLKIWAARK